MLQRIFNAEIGLFAGWGWLPVALLGILIGCIFRLKAKKDMKDNLVAVMVMWLLTHAINFANVPSGYGMMPVLSLSVIAMLGPVTTFMLVGFLVSHRVISKERT